MTLEELRERFVKAVGNTQLVGTRTVAGRRQADYSVDNGADYYLNEGVRILDESLPYPGSFRYEEYELLEGESQILVPNLRSIERAVWRNASDCVNDLRVRSAKDLYEYYHKPFSLLEVNTPSFITRGPVQEITSDDYGEELLTNPSFVDGDEGWSVGDDWTIGGGNASIGADVDSIDRLLIQYLDQAVVGRTALITIIVTYAGTPLTETNRLWFDIGSRENNEVQLGSLSGSGTFEIEARLETFDYVAIRAGSGFIGSVASVSVTNRELHSYPPVLVLPPTSVDAAIGIWGNYWTPRLRLNTDTNYWAYNFSGLVLLAAMIWHEVELRNTTGAREWQSQLDNRLMKLDFDSAEEDTNQRRLPYP